MVTLNGGLNPVEIPVFSMLPDFLFFFSFLDLKLEFNHPKDRLNPLKTSFIDCKRGCLTWGVVFIFSNLSTLK